jgi:hypothetical protein
LGQAGTATQRGQQGASTVVSLARFFPEATPVRLPVQVARTLSVGQKGSDQPSVSDGFDESTIIEFATSREVLFACRTPLEFDDVVRLRTSDGSLDVEASVVAVQYHPGQTIIAARFKEPVPNWIVKS